MACPDPRCPWARTRKTHVQISAQNSPARLSRVADSAVHARLVVCPGHGRRGSRRRRPSRSGVHRRWAGDRGHRRNHGGQRCGGRYSLGWWNRQGNHRWGGRFLGLRFAGRDGDGDIRNRDWRAGHDRGRGNLGRWGDGVNRWIRYGTRHDRCGFNDRNHGSRYERAGNHGRGNDGGRRHGNLQHHVGGHHRRGIDGTRCHGHHGRGYDGDRFRWDGNDGGRHDRNRKHQYDWSGNDGNNRPGRHGNDRGSAFQLLRLHDSPGVPSDEGVRLGSGSGHLCG